MKQTAIYKGAMYVGTRALAGLCLALFFVYELFAVYLFSLFIRIRKNERAAALVFVFLCIAYKALIVGLAIWYVMCVH